MGDVIHIDFKDRSRRQQTRAVAVEGFGKYLPPELSAALADQVCNSLWEIEDAVAEGLRITPEDVRARFERVVKMAGKAVVAAARDALIYSAGEVR